MDIRHYDIIYKLMEDVEKALQGLLEPSTQEVVEGHGEVRTVFSLGRRNKIAGVYVTDGKISRSSLMRVVRDGEVVFDGRVGSLKHFKDDVREMAAGYECGLGIEGFTDVKEGDLLEAYAVR